MHANFLGEPKPGGFPFFSGRGPDCVADPSGLFLVGAINRPRKRKRTNRQNPRRVPRQIGKIPEKSGESQKGQKKDKKEGQVQIGKPPRLKPPHFAALDFLSNSRALPQKFKMMKFSKFGSEHCGEFSVDFSQEDQAWILPPKTSPLGGSS